MRFLRYGLLLVLVLTSAGCRVLGGGGERQPSAERLTWLGRGINTSHWFAQAPVSEDRFQTYITAEDIRLIRRMGFNHIRLSLNPEVLWTEGAPGTMNARHLAHLERAIETILEENLAVIIDLHPEPAFKHRMAREEAFVGQVEAFWGALARRMSRYDANRVFLEVMNEPEFEDAAHWMAVQARLLAAMRRGAPYHTLIATGPRWSSAEELVRITPVADPNVVYNFHLYDPHTFTHQGATWGAPFWRHYGNLPYPSSPEAVAPVIEATANDTARAAIRAYGEERWDRARVEAWVAEAAAWGRRHGVYLTCNEFGVYRRFAPADARFAWLSDVRAALEAQGIGWAMWDYAGGFAVVNTEDGRRVPDLRTLHALGLGSE